MIDLIIKDERFIAEEIVHWIEDHRARSVIEIFLKDLTEHTDSPMAAVDVSMFIKQSLKELYIVPEVKAEETDLFVLALYKAVLHAYGTVIFGLLEKRDEALLKKSILICILKNRRLLEASKIPKLDYFGFSYDDKYLIVQDLAMRMGIITGQKKILTSNERYDELLRVTVEATATKMLQQPDARKAFGTLMVKAKEMNPTILGAQFEPEYVDDTEWARVRFLQKKLEGLANDILLYCGVHHRQNIPVPKDALQHMVNRYYTGITIWHKRGAVKTSGKAKSRVEGEDGFRELHQKLGEAKFALLFKEFDEWIDSYLMDRQRTKRQLRAALYEKRFFKDFCSKIRIEYGLDARNVLYNQLLKRIPTEKIAKES